MIEIWKEWFGQSLSLPVIVMHLTFLCSGIVLGCKMKKKKTIIIVMLTLALLCSACALCMLIDSEMIYIYAVYLGGMFTLILAGSLIGILYGKIKRRENEKDT